MSDAMIEMAPGSRPDDEQRLRWRQEWGELTNGVDYETWIEGHLFSAMDDIKTLQRALGSAQTMCDSLLTIRDMLREGLAAICRTIELNNEQNGFWGVASAHGRIRELAINALEKARIHETQTV